MSKFNLIKERGYIYQTTDEIMIEKLINGEPFTFYLGIDPTADSLHIGHFFALTLVRRLQKMGHHPIILVGGATALVGDPSGKKDLRTVLTKEQVDHNKQEVKNLVQRFVAMDGDNPAIIVDNADWINGESYIDFMRKVGIHFNVNKMLATDCYKNRLQEGGLTFLEMGYMLMQAYDFVYLNRNHNCVMQIGGSDQWANMVAGTELSRKMAIASGEEKPDIYALTCPLLVKADGEKMGKTATGTLWVSRDKTTVYDFYQMFINTYDEDVERLLAFFSDYSMDEIKNICNENIITAKKIMAYEITKLVHGEAEAKIAKETSESVFAGNITDNMPTASIEKVTINMGINIIDLLTTVNIVTSRSEAKRLIEQNGIKLNGERIEGINQQITLADFKEQSLILQKGKKTYLKVILI